MDILIKSATIVYFGTEITNQKSDILIEQGQIVKIAPTIKTSNSIPVFEADNLHVSVGWFDMQVNFNDPGLEHKEDLESGCKAAAFGGYTGVACLSSSHTPTQSKSEIEYIKNKTLHTIVDVYPIGALSQNMEGKTMTEMYDMFKAGAIAFSDNKKPITDSGLLSRCLLYAKGFGGTLLHYPEDSQLANGGKINEGDMSTQLGIKGIPALAEELMVARDISLAEYNSSPLHLSSISTAKSVDLIREAKKKGSAITCGVAVHNLVVNENALADFDSNYKVKPPLRTQADVDALWEGLRDNTIDVICSDHTPQDIESKEQEFDTASFGMVSLETTYALLQSSGSKMSLAQLISKLAINPRKILKLSIPEIKEGAMANLTLFSPTQKWILSLNDIKSKSRNTPFIGKSFTGKVLAIINKNQLVKQ